MSKSDHESFFSISSNLVPVDSVLTYSLYINVSGAENRDHFIRIFPEGGRLAPGEIEEFKKKYLQLYVSEKQRSAYMAAIIRAAGATEIEKTTILKESAIQYLDNLFDEKRVTTPEVLNQNISDCRDCVENMVDVMQHYKIDQLQEMIARLSFHDFYTYDHSINVAMYCVVIYRAMFPTADKMEVVQAGLGGMLHDLGKIKISTQILNNAGQLSQEERIEIQKHPDYGLQLLNSPGVNLPDGVDPLIVSRVVHEHHENFDGTGYPGKLSKEQIHLLARITAVADFFDAVTTKRSYHEALSIEDALALMQRSVGRKLDPGVFQLFAAHTRSHNHTSDQSYAHKHKAFKELPGNFDPCQPQQALPYDEVQPPTPRKAVSSPAQKKAIEGILFNRTKALTAIGHEPKFDSVSARRLVESSLELSFGLYGLTTFTPFVHDLLKIATQVTLKIIEQQPLLPLLLASIHRDKQDHPAGEEHYTASHSVLLAELSCAIAGQIGWNSEPTYSKLISAAFLHDIALGNHGMAKFQRMEEVKEGNHFTKEEIEEFRTHPERASQYARELIGAPSELEIILAQHHEQADGKGFPGQLTQQHLTPLTCLFILAHELLNYFLKNGEDAKWEEWLQASTAKYEGGTFAKILRHLGG